MALYSERGRSVDSGVPSFFIAFGSKKILCYLSFLKRGVFAMSKYTKEDIIKSAQENNVEFIRLQFTDMFGIMKNVAITLSQLEKALDNDCMFDGSSIDGFVRIDESDMYLHPDYDTWTIFPWRKHQNAQTARLICSVYKSDNETPFMGDPRNVLQKVMDEAAEMGFGFNVGPECEFFLFKLDENGNPTLETGDEGGYFDLNPIDHGENCRRDICLALEDMGYTIEASHHEVAEGQHEIDFQFGDVMLSADRVMTFKHVVKTYAAKHGLHATFMPKPIYGINGSGMHTNMSLYYLKDGKNAFDDPNGEMGLSETAYNFIAGIMAHIRGIAAFSNPTVNSYKRLVPGYEAPSYLVWSASNRSCLVRIPAARGKGTRVELRCPDPACNPYLEMALCLAAGLDGIKKKMTPASPIDYNVFGLSDEELKAAGIDCLPGSLKEAIEAAKADPFIKETLGDHVFNNYIEGKENEWDEYRTKVSQWEIDKYMVLY